MAQIFAVPGSSTSDGLVYPDLTGKYVPVLDAPSADSLGITNPWGAGPTAPITGQGGEGSVVGSTPTPSLVAGVSAPSITYSFEGLVGPQGPQGPKGDPGSITTIKQQVFVPYGDNLDVTLQQVRDTWENEGTILYAESAELQWDRTWDPLDVEAGISAWNDASLGSDGEFMGIAADASVYTSTDGGSNWTEKDPGTGPYAAIRVAGTSGKAVVVGVDEVWVTSDSGTNWTEKTIQAEGSPTTLCSHTYGSFISVTALPATFSLYEITGDGDSATYGKITSVIVELYTSTGGSYDLQATLNTEPDGTPSAASTVLGESFTGGVAKQVTFTFSPAVDAKIYSSDYFRISVSKTAGPGTMRYTTGGSPERAYNVTSGSWVSGATVNSIDQGSNGDALAAFTDDGVWLSSDLGDNWTQYKPDSQTGTNWLAGVASSDASYVVAFDDGGNIYRTANGGTSWASLDPSGGESFTPVDIDCGDDGAYMILVGTNATDSTHTAYRSTDYGATWSALNPTIVSGNYNWTECQISNSGELVILSRSGAVYTTFDAGDNWREEAIPTSGSTWDCLALSGDGKAAIISNTAAANEFFVNSGWFSKPQLAETTITDEALTILESTAAATDGNFMVGDGSDWVAESGNTARTSLGVGTGDSPTWTGATFSGLTASRLVAADGAKALASVTDLTAWIAGTADEISVSDDGDGSVTIGLADPLIVGKGGTGAASLTDGGILLGSGTGAVTALAQATDGQLPIGSTGSDPSLATITGTANQISVTNGAGSITLALTGNMDEIAALTPTDSNFIVGNGSTWVAESGATARTSIGLGTGDSVTFAGVTAGASTFGDGGSTNYASFAADGTITLYGTARITREITLTASDFNPGASGPTAAVHGLYPTYEFSINDDMYASFEVPDDWDSSTDIEVSIYWAINEAYATNSAEVQWYADWYATAVGEDVTSPTHTGSIDFGDVDIPASTNLLVKTSGTIAAASLAAGDVVGLHGSRVALDGGNNPTAEPYIIRIEIEWTANVLGGSA